MALGSMLHAYNSAGLWRPLALIGPFVLAFKKLEQVLGARNKLELAGRQESRQSAAINASLARGKAFQMLTRLLVLYGMCFRGRASVAIDKDYLMALPREILQNAVAQLGIAGLHEASYVPKPLGTLAFHVLQSVYSIENDEKLCSNYTRILQESDGLAQHAKKRTLQPRPAWPLKIRRTFNASRLFWWPNLDIASNMLKGVGRVLLARRLVGYSL